MSVHSHRVCRFIYSPNSRILSVYMRYKIRRPTVFETSWQCPIHSCSGRVYVTKSCDRCGNTELSHLLIQMEKMSPLSLISPTQCKPRNRCSILHVSKRFINHFSEVSSGTLRTTEPAFQGLPVDSRPTQPNCEADSSPSAGVQAKHVSSCKSIPPKPSRCARRHSHPYLFELLFWQGNWKFSYLPTKGR
jgi:hypothetical protein